MADLEQGQYQFGPRERGGLMGLRPGQVALIAAAVLTALACMYVVPTGPNALVGLAVLLVAAALAFWPYRGRTLEEWLPIVMMWLARRLRRRHEHRSGVPTAGARIRLASPSGASLAEPELAPAKLPEAVGAIEFLSLPYRAGAIGIAKDGPTLFSTVLRCRVPSFGLLSLSEQEGRLDGWGNVMASFAGERTPISRLQWVERTVPAESDEVGRYFSEERDPAVALSAPSVRSYIELIDSAGAVTQDHEVFVALQLDARRARGAIRKLVRAQRDGPRDRRGRARQVDLAACDLLRREAETLVGRLEEAEIRVDGALPPAAHVRAIRDAYDPYGRMSRARMAAASPDAFGAARAWPVAARESWGHYAADSALHATYWIVEWPRRPVWATFLAPLLIRTTAVRSVAVTLEPVPATRSMRQAEGALTKEVANADVRARWGFVERSRKVLQSEAVSRREQELAEGHAEMRMAGFVTVSGRDQDELDRGCAEIEHAATQAKLGIERMYGQQPEAFTFTVPLCRGLR